MKRLFSVLAIALVFASCGNDDDNNASQDASIVGTFQLTSFSSIFNDDYNGDGVTSTNLLDEVPCFTNTVTFNADATYSLTSSVLVIDLDGNGNSTADCEGPYLETGTYALDGTTLTVNQLTTTDPDGEVDFVIDNGITVITSVGLTITVDTGFGDAVFVYTRQ